LQAINLISSLLTGKKILFFAPSVFGYQTEIANALIKLGARVDYYDERPKNNFIIKASLRLNKKLIKSRIEKYYASILCETATKKYDYVLVINLEALTPTLIKEIRNQHSESIFILYMWDSILNKKSALDAFPLFDWKYSFDKNDAQNITGVQFRPLFFIDKYNFKKHQVAIDKSIDLCFMGTVHSDRYNLIHDIKVKAESLGFTTYFFMYFPSPVLFWYKKLKDIRFYKASYSEFSFKPLDLNEIANIIFKSKVVLDIQHPKQTGLTMRTIEMIGAERKLITTNASIKEYDFYDEHNILIIDREQPVINRGFFTEPYIPIDTTIKNNYSIEGWIKEIFKLDH